MLAVALVGVLVGSVGCKDYDDDIDDLNNRVDNLTATVDKLQALIDGGAVITNVQKGSDGIVVTLSDNSTFTLTNGQDGKDGKDGKDAVVWTIGNDGFWYQDGAKTDYKAIGVDGANGTNGKDGEDGEDGCYYVPNSATGCFDIYKDGQKVEGTNISWTTAAGVSAVYAGNELKLTNVEGYEGELVLTLGAQLGSVGFVPECVDPAFTTYPTTTDPFYHLESYIAEEKYNADGTFKPQTDWEKSNVVEFIYRLNPSDAYVGEADKLANVAFIDRVVEKVSRAAGDSQELLNVFEAPKYAQGEVTVKGTINASELADQPEYNVAALQVWEGQNPVTSDYVYVSSKPIDAVIANTKKTEVGKTAVEFYNRTKSWKSSQKGEDDAFVKQFVGKVDATAAHFTLPYDNGSIDLNPLVALYSNDIFNYLEKDDDKGIDGVGFEGITYKFYTPSDYLADDDKHTDQQEYINPLNGDGSVVSLSSKYTTSAIGRKPIVRVDAIMKDNAGVEQLFASAYIKLVVAPGTATPAEGHNITIGGVTEVDYRKIPYETPIGEMGWSEVSQQLYDVENLTANTFWDAYKNQYKVKITVEGEEDPIFEKNDVPSNQVFNTSTQGVDVQINLNPADETSAYVKVNANNTIKTQHTYPDGAVYTVEITILPNDENVHGKFVLTKTFTVTDSCPMYTFKTDKHFTLPLFKDIFPWLATTDIKNPDIIATTGRIVNDAWEMTSSVNGYFVDKDGKQLLSYYKTDDVVTHVTNLVFEWKNPTSAAQKKINLDGNTTDYIVSLDGPMSVQEIVEPINVIQTLANGEDCEHVFDLVVYNPFIAKATNGVSVDVFRRSHEVATIDKVGVIEAKSQLDIYTYDAVSEALKLSENATKDYKLTDADVTVEYSFVDNDDFQSYNTENHDSLSIDQATGVITWEHGSGAEYGVQKTLTVEAKVNFKDIVIVTCKIPVVMNVK